MEKIKMKNVKKVLSGGLCALIAMLAHGIGAYQAAAQDLNVRAEVPSGMAMPLTPTSIGLQMQNLGMDSAHNFLDASFGKGVGDLIQALPQNVAKVAVNASQSAETKSAPKLPAEKSLSAPKRLGTSIQKTAKSFAVKFNQIHAAVSQKVSASISDKTRGLTSLFDGSNQAEPPAPSRDNGSFMDRLRQIPGVETTDLTGPRIMTIGINAAYPVATIEAEVRAKVPELSRFFVKIVYVDAANPGKILATDDLVFLASGLKTSPDPNSVVNLSADSVDDAIRDLLSNSGESVNLKFVFNASWPFRGSARGEVGYYCDTHGLHYALQEYKFFGGSKFVMSVSGTRKELLGFFKEIFTSNYDRISGDNLGGLI